MGFAGEVLHHRAKEGPERYEIGHSFGTVSLHARWPKEIRKPVAGRANPFDLAALSATGLADVLGSQAFGRASHRMNRGGWEVASLLNPLQTVALEPGKVITIASGVKNSLTIMAVACFVTPNMARGTPAVSTMRRGMG